MTAPDDGPAPANLATPQQVEARELNPVIEILERAFPNVQPRVVRHAAHQAHRGFSDSPVRDFVPLLVERAARDALIRQSGQLPTQTHASPVIGGAPSAAAASSPPADSV